MALFFSAATLGFYDDTVHATMPPDVRPITRDAHTAIMDAASSGMMIAANDNGDPIAVPPPPPPADQLARQLRTKRDKLLAASDFTQVPDSPFTAAEREEWRLYRQALRDLPETTLDPSAVAWPNAPA
ncbi:tail fiber assembly protein [Novosphingobium lindaniclasticum]|uniref:Phage tail assembly chaperone-like domain-containing protein n=1 Tax=Novosphingobium lindaniclasticum LE124 TaxID=1096930 RepID=T0HC14_9SPHN|nr:phage tail assembly chaperone [Novosphingobium lindaniclasticum]EQB09673.1 hypothetical protein L284_18850 [Novosphingobium lindaniclasticum LE124]